MRTTYDKELFHDEAAHKIERRVAILLAAPLVILALYGLFYHFAARLAY